MRPPILTFKVHPNPRGSLYWLVDIFESRKDMYSWCDKNCHSYYEGSHDYAAITHSFYAIGIDRRATPFAGRIHLTRRCLTMRIITHESAHAALAWYRRKVRPSKHKYENDFILDLADERNEETFCRALDNIASRIVRRTRKVTIER